MSTGGRDRSGRQCSHCTSRARRARGSNAPAPPGGSSLDAEPGRPGATQPKTSSRVVGSVIARLSDASTGIGISLIAGSAWSSGSGALAAVAAEQALQIDPGYRLALLLGRAVELGARPRRCA